MNHETDSKIASAVKFPAFRLVEFNARRVRRGAEGARVEVRYSSEPDDFEWLWMSAQDVRDNLAEFGADAELEKALAVYA